MSEWERINERSAVRMTFEVREKNCDAADRFPKRGGETDRLEIKWPLFLGGVITEMIDRRQCRLR